MQGEEALKTVEQCLRGRLLAERAASKAATDTADLLTTKLKELEEKLKIEEKCRRKAEKKFNILKKKLESLKIGFNYNNNNNSEESDECSIISFSTDQFSENSCVTIISSSSTATSNSSTVFRDPPGDLINPRSVSSSSNADRGERIESDIKVERDQVTANLSGILKPSALEEREKEGNQREDDEHQHVNDSMALVPLSLPIESNDPSNNKKEVKVNNERVREVLDTLKQIRENIQSTMERRRVIQVG